MTMRFTLLVCLFVLWLNVDISLSQNGCGTPPPLEHGDVKHTMKSWYNHDESVEYMCQAYHTLEGQPYRTCANGEWTGRLRCLKPCVVTDSNIQHRNIAFKYGRFRKMYSVHNDEIEFRCTTGRPVGTSMRQRCNDGVMPLPLCQ